MGETDDLKVIAIVWVGFIPVAVLLIFFTFLVIASNPSLRVRDAIVCSLLVTRLGHCAGVVLMVCLFLLYNWQWTELLCEIMLWMWIAYIMADIFTAVTSTGYHAAKMGRQDSCAACTIGILLFVSWAGAVALGASPILTTNLFYNYEVNDKNHTRKCFLGVNKDSDNTLHLGVNMFLVVTILLCLMLVIAILAEAKIALKKIKLKRRSPLTLDSRMSAKTCPRGMKKVAPHLDSKEIKDIKYIHYAAVYCTGLFNCAPQLVSQLNTHI